MPLSSFDQPQSSGSAGAGFWFCQSNSDKIFSKENPVEIFQFF